MFHGNLSFISTHVFIVIVSMPDLYNLNPCIKKSHFSWYVKTGSWATASIKRVKFMPINTFLKTPQYDFCNAAGSVLCKSCVSPCITTGIQEPCSMLEKQWQFWYCCLQYNNFSVSALVTWLVCLWENGAGQWQRLKHC